MLNDGTAIQGYDFASHIGVAVGNHEGGEFSQFSRDMAGRGMSVYSYKR